MAQFLWKPLARGVGTGSLVSVYTTPTGYKTLVKAMTVTNPTGGVLTLVVKVMQDSALDAGTFRSAIPGQSLASNQTYTCPEMVNQMLNATGQIELSGNGLEFLVSGAELLQ